MSKAVFLDRDGTINEEMGYINHIGRFRVFDFVPEAIRLFNENGFKVIVITNQSGVARGYFTEELLREIHNHLIHILESRNARIDKIYYCPHHPVEGTGEYRKDCNCRKPKTGMIDRARQDFDIEMNQSYMIGDRFKDMEFGKRVGLKTIFLLTGYGKGEYTYQKSRWPFQPDHICKNLHEAAIRVTSLVK
jgi:D-glycero-D-manno-heptose 1,7-bisphosphate phosphatase